jgi:hypothetical protein
LARKPEGLDYFDFEAVSEPWNTYLLSDGTRLKVKFILQKMLRVKGADGTEGAGMANSLVVVTESPKQLRGNPGRSYSTVEIENAPKSQKVRWKAVKTSPGVYRTADGRVILVDLSPTEILRSRLFGPDGEPQYLIRTITSVRVVPPPQFPKVEVQPLKPALQAPSQ